MVEVIQGDCLDVLAGMPAESVDACVTDPPYGLGFMGKEWDTPGAMVERKPDRSVKWDKVGGNHNPSNSADASRTRRVEGLKFQSWCEAWAREVLRVLKPGGYLLAFGGTRTQHRLVCAIEDAGFEVRDQIGWAYGSGFPKSLDVSKAIDKNNGKPSRHEEIERYLREKIKHVYGNQAAAWQGWGTALKPAWESIAVCRKPLGEKTVAANVLAHGTGALNIDATRIETSDDLNGGAYSGNLRQRDEYTSTDGDGAVPLSRLNRGSGEYVQPLGRWPANLCHDGSDEVLACFPEAGGGFGVRGAGGQNGIFSPIGGTGPTVGFGDTGSAARFFYNAGRDGEPSADRRYTEEGSTNFAAKPGMRREAIDSARLFYTAKASSSEREGGDHPTVKPVALMRWLVRLVTPPGGTVLDPFAGSGTTGVACQCEGFDAVLIEREPKYVKIARRRLSAGPLFYEAAD